MVVAKKEDNVEKKALEIDIEKLMSSPAFLERIDSLLKEKQAVQCEDDNSDRSSVVSLPKEPTPLHVKVVTCLVGNSKAIQLDLKFDGDRERSWCMKADKDLIPSKAVNIDAAGYDKVLLKTVFAGGSRSLLLVTVEEDQHTCLFVNKEQKIRITYIKGKVEVMVDHEVDLQGLRANGLVFGVTGMLCADKLFTGEYSEREHERYCTDGYSMKDQNQLIAALPQAKSLFFGA